MEPTVLQWKDNNGTIHYKTIPSGQLSKVDVDQMGLSGKKIEGNIYHLTAKSPKGMDKAGAKYEGVVNDTDVKKIQNYSLKY